MVIVAWQRRGGDETDECEAATTRKLLLAGKTEETRDP